MANSICSMCSGTGISPNFAKSVDPPVQKYGTMLENSPQRDDSRRKPAQTMCCPGVCVPTPQCAKKNNTSTQINVPCDAPTTCPKFVCEPCAPSPPTKIWLIKSTPMPQKSDFLKHKNPFLGEGVNELFRFYVSEDIGCTLKVLKNKQKLQSFCLPIGGSFDQGSPSSDDSRSMMVCFPCQPTINKPPEKKKKEELKPIGYISRNKDVDFIGGKLIGGCTCGKKNGLSGSCPRISCQNNPGCTMNPPRCWPQFKEPEPPPPPPPDQKMICVPVQLVYYNPPNNK